MRDIITIVNKMLRVIPHTEVSLINMLEGVKERAVYTPPEVSSLRWEELTHAAVKLIVPNSTYVDWGNNDKWRNTAIDIMMDRS